MLLTLLCSLNNLKNKVNLKQLSKMPLGNLFNINTLFTIHQEISLLLYFRSYFSNQGIQYSLCRIPMGGTDFSTHGYSYDDGNTDTELNNFSLTSEDYDYKVI